MLIYLVVLDGVFDIGLAALMDVIGTAKELIPLDQGSVQLDIRLVGVRRKVHTAHGLTVPVQLAAELADQSPDFVLIPALGAKMPLQLVESLSRSDVKDVAVWIKKWQSAGACVGAACTGTFVLAETGLLNGL